MNTDLQNSLFDFLEPLIEAAAPAEVLSGAALHDTVYQSVKTDKAVRIGNMEAQLAPNPGSSEIELFDAPVLVITLSRVKGDNKTERRAARDEATNMALDVALLINHDETLGGRMDKVRALTIRTGFDNIDGLPYAVAHLVVVANETGEVDFRNWRGV